MFTFSRHGIQNEELFSNLYADFIGWCKSKVNKGTFSTYTDGEPVFLCSGIEISYSHYLKSK